MQIKKLQTNVPVVELLQNGISVGRQRREVLATDVLMSEPDPAQVYLHSFTSVSAYSFGAI